ncbi:MAG TPA: glycosyltransferase family 1 protein, partial [Chitinophagaceae bacterium]|nr:glycosyltransferase family 1 protein [Chitinophagaceae bacterium]
KDIDFVTAKDFPAIYKQALCMIYPSIFEGFGIPVLEALTAGTPVITSNISCLPEAG